MTDSRRNRDSSTRSLIAICDQLDEKQSGTFSWTHPFVHVELQSHFTINSVWVVGSFARGALTCGDLDLVVDIDWHGSSVALPHKVFKALSIRHQGVSLCDGTPDNNSSLVAFGDAILIWDRHGNDWRSAINNIVTDPNAGRFSRAADDIPFRPDQLACNIKEMANLLKLRDEGLIKWDFTHVSSPPRHEPPTKQQIEVLNLFVTCGSQTQRLLQHLLPYFYFHQWPSVYRRAQLSRSIFQLGDSTLSIGRPAVPITLLDKLNTACLMIVPHMRGDAVNGVWCIKRGDLHPLTLATERLKIWALSDSSGQLDFYNRAGISKAGIYVESNNGVAIDLFTSLEDAQRWVDTTLDDERPAVRPVCLTPQILLACIASADIVSVDITDFALTRSGAQTLGVVGTVTPAALVDVLAG